MKLKPNFQRKDGSNQLMKWKIILKVVVTLKVLYIMQIVIRQAKSGV